MDNKGNPFSLEWIDIGVHPISTSHVWREFATHLLKQIKIHNGRDFQCYTLQYINGEVTPTRHLGTELLILEDGFNVVCFVGARGQYTFQIYK